MVREVEMMSIPDPGDVRAITCLLTDGQSLEQAIVRTSGEIRVGRLDEPYWVILHRKEIDIQVYVHEAYPEPLDLQSPSFDLLRPLPYWFRWKWYRLLGGELGHEDFVLLMMKAKEQ